MPVKKSKGGGYTSSYGGKTVKHKTRASAEKRATKKGSARKK